MNILKLEKEYKKLKELEDPDDGIFEFKKLLLENDTPEVLNFHIKILKDEEDLYLQRDLRSFFSKRKDIKKVKEFIFDKIQEGVDDQILSQLIHILGSMRSKLVKPIVYDNINSTNRNMRYKCIIVLGWIGSTIKDLDVLNKQMIHDIDEELRGYCATAMRQIWLGKKSMKNRVSEYISIALPLESEEKALVGMIITLQDIYRKKFGIKESQYGDISGNADDSKQKAIKFLQKL